MHHRRANTEEGSMSEQRPNSVKGGNIKTPTAWKASRAPIKADHEGRDLCFEVFLEVNRWRGCRSTHPARSVRRWSG